MVPQEISKSIIGAKKTWKTESIKTLKKTLKKKNKKK